jgi:hypothetical protein
MDVHIFLSSYFQFLLVYTQSGIAKLNDISVLNCLSNHHIALHKTVPFTFLSPHRNATFSASFPALAVGFAFLPSLPPSLPSSPHPLFLPSYPLSL